MPFNPHNFSTVLKPKEIFLKDNPPELEKPDILFFPNFLTKLKADTFFSELLAELQLHPDEVFIYNKIIKTKRLIDFRSDQNKHYTYSGKQKSCAPWTPNLTILKELLFHQFNYSFNACLCNFYENGSVGMGWHSDKERELGPTPLIASISFGQSRLFQFRYRKPWVDQNNQVWSYELNHGSLLIMQGKTQQYFEHQLKTDKSKHSRLNLTFRTILTS